MRYILDESGEPVLCEDLHRWAEWFEQQENRRVAWTDVGEEAVSTVFLGIDHSFNFSGDAVPVLWETMVLRTRPLDPDLCESDTVDQAAERERKSWEEQWRYSTRQEAEDGHKAVVEWLETEEGKKGEGSPNFSPRAKA